METGVCEREESSSGHVIVIPVARSISSPATRPARTGTGWRGRPSFRRDISHELEFTSFVGRKQFSSRPAVSSGPFIIERSLSEDLLAAEGRLVVGRKKMVSEYGKEAMVGGFVDDWADCDTLRKKERASADGWKCSKRMGDAKRKEDDADDLEKSGETITILRKEPELIQLQIEEEEGEYHRTMERRLNRARQLRRTTVMHYDQQEDTFKRRRAPQLFELAVLIELESNDGSNENLFPSNKYSYVPKINFVYPPKTPQHLQPLVSTLPALCYADLGRARLEDPERYKDEQFLMIITDSTGDRKFAYCHRFAPIDLSKFGSESGSATVGRNGTVTGQLERVLPQILCIVTPVNAYSFYFDLVHEAALRSKSGNMNMLTRFLTQSFRHRLPPPNGFVTVKLVDEEEANEEETEGADIGWEVVLINRATPKKDQGLGDLLDRLGIDRLLKLFFALLCEKRVLLVADSVPVLSRSVQAAGAMLGPFDWPHTLIPIVPDPFLHLCYSPAPYLMGVLSDHSPNLQSLIFDDEADLDNQEEYILIMDIDRTTILKDKDWATSGIADFSPSSTKLLPNRITSALKQRLKQAMKSNQEREQKVIDAFQWAFVKLVGHYRDHIKMNDYDKTEFDRVGFIEAPSSRNQRTFLNWFTETGMFQVWINRKLDSWCRSTQDPFDKRLDQAKATGSDSRAWSWARF